MRGWLGRRQRRQVLLWDVPCVEVRLVRPQTGQKSGRGVKLVKLLGKQVKLVKGWPAAPGMYPATNRRTLVNSVKLDDKLDQPLKSARTLILHVGF